MANLRRPLDMLNGGYTANTGYNPEMPEADPNSPLPPQVPAVEQPPAAPPPQAPPPPPTGGYDLEKVRKGWAYGGAGFGSNVTLNDLQKFLADNQSFTQGVTMRGEKLYDPQGRFMFDAIGNFKSGDPRQMTRIALDGKGPRPKGKGPKLPPGPPGTRWVDSGHGNDPYLPDGTRNPNYKPPKGKNPGGGLDYFGDPKTWKPGMSVAFSHDIGGKIPAGWVKTGKGQYTYKGVSKPPTPPNPGGGTVDPSQPGHVGPQSQDDIMTQLSKLFPNGLFNQNLVNSRVSSANDALNAGRKSRLATNRAAMAERGILNSQDPASMNRMDEKLFDSYAGSVRDIFNDESQASDARMMQALTTAAGLSTDQARLVIDRFRANNEHTFNMGNLKLGEGRLGLDRELGRGNLALGNRNASINERLGLGQLALGNLNAQNQYNLGLGGLGLDRDRLQWQIQNGDTDSLIRLLQLYLNGAQSTTGGTR